jgi:Ca-activated chloride channel family protein
MVLVTDGEQGEIPQALRPRQGAQLAAPFDITIMVVDPGNDAVVESKIAADQFAAQNRVNAKKALQDVAKMTGGRYFAARDSATLLDACSELGKQLDLLEREATGTLHRRQYLEGYAWFAAAAFVLICGVMALDLMIWRRVP